jgi:hypothetical protein
MPISRDVFFEICLPILGLIRLIEPGGITCPYTLSNIKFTHNQCDALFFFLTYTIKLSDYEKAYPTSATGKCPFFKQ